MFYEWNIVVMIIVGVPLYKKVPLDQPLHTAYGRVKQVLFLFKSR